MNLYPIFVVFHLLGSISFIGGIFYIFVIIKTNQFFFLKKLEFITIYRIIRKIMLYSWFSINTVIISGWTLKVLIIVDKQKLNWSVIYMLIVGNIIYVIFIFLNFKVLKKLQYFLDTKKKIIRKITFNLQFLLFLSIILAIIGVMGRFFKS